MIYAKQNTITLSQTQQKYTGITDRKNLDDLVLHDTSIVVDMANDELNAVVNRTKHFCLLTDTAFMKV